MKGSPRPGRRPRVGLVLSGGGARGLAHIGVLKVLHREGIPIDLLAGTSMGGLIAAAYAVGLTPDYMEAEALRMGRIRNLTSLVDRDLPRAGLFEGKRVEEYLVRQLGNVTFSDLQVPLALVAVDLAQGEEVVLRGGFVAEAVRATISLPGVFAPARLGDRLLVDGGVLNNLPVDVAREMGADVVIAVDSRIEFVGLAASDESSIFGQWKEILDVLRACLLLMQRQLTEYRVEQAHPEAVIRPILPKGVATLTGFSRAAEIITAGETAAEAALPQIEHWLMRGGGGVARKRPQ